MCIPELFSPGTDFIAGAVGKVHVCTGNLVEVVGEYIQGGVGHHLDDCSVVVARLASAPKRFVADPGSQDRQLRAKLQPGAFLRVV
ncbi:MAG: hypothetical protein ACRD3T_08930 [Terriglobia bacterium]